MTKPRPTTIAGRADAGTATAETAVVLPVLVLVTALAVWTLVAVAVRLACVEAARAGARAAARGDPPPVIVARAGSALGVGKADVTVRRTGDVVVVTVVAGLPGPLRLLLPGRRLAASAEAVAETPGGVR